LSPVNRALFDDRIEHGLAQARRHGWTLAVMFVDLDNFKSINDIHGHETGDTVLKIISDRLKKITRRDDTICRHGGDEFLYLLLEISEEKDAIMIAQKLILAIQEPCVIEALDPRVAIEVFANMRIAFSPKHGDDAQSLIGHADRAMYEAKRSKSGYSVAPSNAESL